MSWWDQAFPFVIGATATLVATVLVDALRGRRERRHRFDAQKFSVYVDALRACNDAREVLRELGKLDERHSAIAASLEEFREPPTAANLEEVTARHEALKRRQDALREDTDQLKPLGLRVHESLSASRAAMHVVAPRIVLTRHSRLRVAAEDDRIDSDEYGRLSSATADAMRRDLGTQRWLVLELAGAVPHFRKHGIDPERAS